MRIPGWMLMEKKDEATGGGGGGATETPPEGQPGSVSVGDPPQDKKPGETKAKPKDQQPTDGPQTLTREALARLRSKERRKGEHATVERLNTEARAAGFSSLKDMVAFAKRALTAQRQARAAQPGNKGKPSTAPAQTQPKPGTETPADAQPAQPQGSRAERRLAAEVKRRKQLERSLADQEVTSELRIAAAQAGVKDVDYAIHVLTKLMAKKTDAERKNFDENHFFAEVLKRSHPHLYVATEEPATTTTTTKTPAAPTTHKVDKDKVDEQKIDAKTMPRDAYHKLLRERGLVPPDQGLSY